MNKHFLLLVTGLMIGCAARAQCGGFSLSDINITDATNCPGQPGILGSIEVLPVDPDFIYTLSGGGDVFGPQSGNQFINLSEGIIYFLHVEDENGCIIDTAVTVGLGANAVTAAWNAGALQDVTCFGDQNGAASISNVSGGITPPYDVTWTHTTGLHDLNMVNIGGGDSQANLFGGAWVVTATDQEGCAWSQLFTVFEPDELTVAYVINEPTCYQFSDGSLTVNTTGGNGGNVYFIGDISGQLNPGNTNTVNSLQEAWYYITVVDASGCNFSDSVFIDDPDEIAVDVTIIHPLCYDDSTGSISADTVYNYGGNYGSIIYIWSPNPSGTNGIGATTNNNLYAGNYSLTINDENGCSKGFDFIINEADSLYFVDLGVQHSEYDTSMSWQPGAVYCAAAGGAGSISYEWENLQTGATATTGTWGNLLPGDYQVTVTDANGCSITDTVTIGYAGITGSENMQLVSIYPNPVKNHLLYVDCTSLSAARFVVYNLYGDCVLDCFLDSGLQTVELDFSAGTYLYQIIADSDELQHGKIMIAD